MEAEMKHEIFLVEQAVIGHNMQSLHVLITVQNEIN